MRLSRNDLRIAMRVFARHRTFSLAAVFSLGLAIALNTTMYSVIDAMVNPRIDVAHPERLYSISLWGDFHNKVDARTRADLLRSGFRSFDALASITRASTFAVGLEHGGHFQLGMIAYVTPNIFDVLGVRPIAGRSFTDADYTDPSAPIVITDQVASTLFPDGASAVGSVVDLDGAPHPVIAVIERTAQLGHSEVWMLPPPTLPLSAIAPTIIRLRPGARVEELDHELSTIAARLGTLAGLGSMGAAYRLSPIEAPQFRALRFHYALVAAVVAVLLIACANLANLQLARGLGRSRELALRAALGATRRDIVGQLLLESGLLAAAGLALGLVLTFWANALLTAHLPPAVGEYVMQPQTSWRVFAFAVVACLVCLLFIGLLPALHVSRVDPNDLLKSAAGTGANKRNRNKYSLMIVVEIGLSLALLSGMALLIRSAASVRAADAGYDMTPLTQVSLGSRHAAGTYVHYVDVQTALTDRVRGVPGVADVAAVMRRGIVDNSATVADVDGDKTEVMTPTYGYSIVSPSYFRTLGLPILKGRDFTDGVASEGELIIDEPTARFLWPNGRAVGGLIKLGSDSSHAPWVRVVGVVKATRRFNEWTFRRAEDGDVHGLGAIYYRPAARDSFLVAKSYSVDLFVRAAHDPERMPMTVRRVLANVPSYELRWSDALEAAVGLRRMRASYDFVAGTFVLFTALAVGLAAIGIYGIVAHSVAERRRELGVRIALGASPRDILRAVLREGNAVALGGVAVGLLCTKYTVQWLRAFSFESDQTNAPLFAAMAAVLFIIAVIAALVPAMRATRIDPVEALRSE